MQASNPRAASAMTRATKSVIEQLEQRRLMSAGAPDTTFGTNGLTLSDFAGANDDGRSIAVQSNGNIVVLASKGGSSHLLSYNAQGQRDTSFDVTVDVSQARAIAVQSDDSILVVGTASSSIGANGTSDIAVERFSANGVFDSAFGVKTVDFAEPVTGASGDDLGWAVATSGSDIVVAGTTNFGGINYAAVAKISGSTTTKAEIDLDSPGVNVLGMAVQANGGIVVAGSDPSEGNFAVERFTPTLGVDHNFGDDNSGVAVLLNGNAVSIATDGNDIVIDGHSFDDFGGDIGSVIKLDGATGAQVWKTDLDFGGFNSDAQGIAVQSDHKVVVGGMVLGFANTGFIARLNAGGSMDAGFGSNGISQVTVPDGYSDSAIESVAIQSDGNIVGAGAAIKFDSVNSHSLDSDVLVTRVFGSDVTPPANTAPVSSNSSGSLNEDGSLTIDLKALTIDGESASGDLVYSVVTTTAHGVLVNNGNGTVTYTPAGNYNGSDSFTFKANDGQVDGNTATVNLSIAAVNDGPVGTADSYSTNEDTALSKDAAHGVLANDSDVDGDQLTATVYAGTAHGNLTLNADGSFTYTPFANVNGGDTFQYTLSDGTTTSGPITVTLTVNAVNDAPVAVNDSAYTVQNGTPLVVTAAQGVLMNDSDVDGDALTSTLVSGPAHGTLTLNADGSFTYNAAAGFVGTDTFIYKANDGHGGSANATASISVTTAPPANHAPVANAGPDQTVDENLPVAFNGTQSTDADHDALSYAWNFGDGNTGTGATPTHAFTNSGLYTVTLTVNDGHGGSSTDTMQVRVLSPQEAVLNIIAQVGTDVLQGDMTINQALNLSNRLANTLVRLTRDDYNAAIGQLNSFISTLNGWVNGGKISAADALPLKNSALNLISSIQLEMA